MVLRNLIFSYMTSFDYCFHHHMNANELWLYMFALVIILSKILAIVSNKGSHFRWWDPRAALPMGSE
jgi:hypothetical protein